MLTNWFNQLVTVVAYVCLCKYIVSSLKQVKTLIFWIFRQCIKSKFFFISCFWVNTYIMISFFIVDQSSTVQCSFNKSTTDRTLLYETRYFINASKSKYISVGIIYDHYKHCLKPCVWIGGSRVKNCVVLDQDDWSKLLSHKQVINSTECEAKAPILLNLCTISFESFNDVRVMKIEDNSSNIVYLGDESVLGLWLISDVVEYRLNMLQCLNFDSFFKNMVTSVGNFNFNTLVDSVTNKLNSMPINEKVCIAKEIVVHYPTYLETFKQPLGYYQ